MSSVTRAFAWLLTLLVFSSMFATTLGKERVKRGGFGHGGYAYSTDLLIGAGVGGNLAMDQSQRNMMTLSAGDLGNAFDVGDYASSIAKAARTSAAAGSKFKGSYGK